MDLQSILTVAQGLAQAASLHVAFTDKTTWAWNPGSRTLYVPREAAQAYPRGVVLGLIAHEVGHCLATRCYLFTADGARDPLLHPMLNALEDPRVERIVGDRFVGARAWLSATREAFAGTECTHIHTLDALTWFVKEGWAMDEGRDDADALDAAAAPLTPAVLEALRATRGARRRYLLLFTPDPSSPPSEALVARHADLGLRATSDAEAQIRVLAYDALQVALNEILPWVARLRQLDEARLARALDAAPNLHVQARRALQALAAAAVRSVVGGLLRHPSARDDAPGAPTPGSAKTAHALMDVILGASKSRYGAAPTTTDHGALAEVPPTPDEVVRSLAERLTQFVPLRGAQRDVGGTPRGARLDLPRAMAFQATHKDHKVFRRRDLPTHRDAAAVLCIDLSGSMDGAKIAAAVAATKVFASVLRQLEIPFEVLGYQDATVMVIPFSSSDQWGEDESMSARVDALCGEPSGDRIDADSQPRSSRSPNWTDIAPALHEAASHLDGTGAVDTFVFLISDGEPNGRHSTEADLLDAVKRLSLDHTLLGIGVGEGTSCLAKWFPNSVTEVPPEELHVAVGTLLEQALATVLAS